MSKVFISAGHGGSDSGAVGNGFKEKDLNLSIALACGDYLKSKGVNVLMSRTGDEEDGINQEAKESNAFGPDLTVSIHNNAGGGDGVEAWYSIYGGKSKECAENILSEVTAIGQNSRGAKCKKGANGKDYYGFIRQTVAPAVIVECAFIDNAADIAIVDTEAKRKTMGEAIAKGILKTLGISYSEPAPAPAPVVEAPKAETTTVNTFKSYIAKVTVASLNIRSGAGTNNKITGVIKDRGSYTIVEESAGRGSDKGWGKLKSGAGWISLDFVKKI